MRIYISLLLLLSLLTSLAWAATFPSSTPYQVCFTPKEDCTSLIVDLIDQAKTNIYIQGYSFTSRPIARALVNAERRGVTVLAIFDRSQFSRRYHSLTSILIRAGIPVWNDNTLNIAHNKVIIVDRSIVETGSFNFTHAAQFANAENVLIIHDTALAEQYLKNWQERQKESVKVNKNQ